MLRFVQTMQIQIRRHLTCCCCRRCQADTFDNTPQALDRLATGAAHS
jgi:hypothetical protein